MTVDLLITGGRVASLRRDLSVTDDAIGVIDDEIVYLGAKADAPEYTEEWDVGGRLVTPGLIDCHTHLVYGGDRLADFARRVSGSSYTEIATTGGGIRSTVAATMATSEDELATAAAGRLRWLAESGATTVEVKSGYGTTTEVELAMLRAAVAAGVAVGVSVEPTLLAAHVVPEGMDRSTFVRYVVEEMVPAAVDIATAVDVFVETIAFTAEDAAAIFDAARGHGLAIKAHVGQLSELGGAEVAAQHGALSIDHCEHVAEAALPALAAARTVAVLAPGASLFLGESERPDIHAFRSHGIPLAVTTDLNPGSSPLASLPLAATLAVHRFGLTPLEALQGVTSNAAQALGLDDRGVIEVGRRADLAVWDADDPREIVYWMGTPMCHDVVVGGHRGLRP